MLIENFFVLKGLRPLPASQQSGRVVEPKKNTHILLLMKSAGKIGRKARNYLVDSCFK